MNQTTRIPQLMIGLGIGTALFAATHSMGVALGVGLALAFALPRRRSF